MLRLENATLLGHIVDMADYIRKSQQKLQQATCAINNCVVTCILAEGGSFENLL
jgi:23S rRNA maturation-related 3'-5' exoribonuclease YhaM